MKKIILFIILVYNCSCFANSYYKYNIYINRYVIYDELSNQDSMDYYLLKSYYAIPDKSKFPRLYQVIEYADKHNDTNLIKDALHYLSINYDTSTIRSSLNFYKLQNIIAKYTLESNPNSYSLKSDIKYDSIIQFMTDRDQLAIKNAVKYYKIYGDSISNYSEFIDSLNFIVIEKLLLNKGFPKTINFNTIMNFSILLLHIDHYEWFIKIKKTILNALKKGNINPIDYARIFDRCLISSGMKPYYYIGVPGFKYEKPIGKELILANKNRAKIGCPPVEETKQYIQLFFPLNTF